MKLNSVAFIFFGFFWEIKADRRRCLEIKPVELGHNFVEFCCGATNFTARRLTRNYKGRLHLGPPKDLKTAKQLVFTEVLQLNRGTTGASTVPLMVEDGFYLGEWHAVCANNFHTTSSNPKCRRQTCAMARICNCHCQHYGLRFLTYTVGIVPIEPSLYKTGFLVMAAGQSEQIILPVRTEIKITWNPFRCLDGFDCNKPSITMVKTIKPGMYRGRKPKSILFTEFISLDTQGEGHEFEVTLYVVLDLRSLSKSFPDIGDLPSEYRVQLDTVKFYKNHYRNDTVILYNPLLDNYGDKLTRDINCQVIKSYDSSAASTSTLSASLLQNCSDAKFQEAMILRFVAVVLILMRKI